MPDRGKPIRWVRCRIDTCRRKILASDKRHHREVFNGVALYTCQDCYEKNILRQTREAFRDSDRERELWE